MTTVLPVSSYESLRSSQPLETPPHFKVSTSGHSPASGDPPFTGRCGVRRPSHEILNDWSASQRTPNTTPEPNRATIISAASPTQEMSLSPPSLLHHATTSHLASQPLTQSMSPGVGQFEASSFLPHSNMGSSPLALQNGSATGRLRFDSVSPTDTKTLRDASLLAARKSFPPGPIERDVPATPHEMTSTLADNIQASKRAQHHSTSPIHTARMFDHYINTELLESSSPLSSPPSSLSQHDSPSVDVGDVAASPARRAGFSTFPNSTADFREQQGIPQPPTVPKGPVLRSGQTWQIQPPKYVNELRSLVDPNFSRKNWGDIFYFGAEGQSFPYPGNMLVDPHEKNDRIMVERSLQQRAEDIEIPDAETLWTRAVKHIGRTGTRHEENEAMQKEQATGHSSRVSRRAQLDGKNMAIALAAPAGVIDEEFREFVRAARLIPRRTASQERVMTHHMKRVTPRRTSKGISQKKGGTDVSTRSEPLAETMMQSRDMKGQAASPAEALADAEKVSMGHVEQRRMGWVSPGRLIIDIHRDAGSWEVQQSTYNVNARNQLQQPMMPPPSLTRVGDRGLDVHGSPQIPLPLARPTRPPVLHRSTPHRKGLASRVVGSEVRKPHPGLVGLGPWTRKIGEVVWPDQRAFH